ncbi:MAG: hypothetical protein NTY01_02970 [Verrucomicrobia bacterium]|nr:hypothetical protein [Verrucomicrobiota bacterium]
MTYMTLEVDIDHGKVLPKEANRLPESGRGLLTILEPAPAAPTGLTPLQALEALQKHLRLDEKAAAQWMAAVRDARR